MLKSPSLRVWDSGKNRFCEKFLKNFGFFSKNSFFLETFVAKTTHLTIFYGGKHDADIILLF